VYFIFSLLALEHNVMKAATQSHQTQISTSINYQQYLNMIEVIDKQMQSVISQVGRY